MNRINWATQECEWGALDALHCVSATLHSRGAYGGFALHRGFVASVESGRIKADGCPELRERTAPDRWG